MSIEVGLIGVGPWGANILRDLNSLGVVVHCCARSDGSSERARAGGAASIVEHPHDLPETCAGFVIATRTISHIESILAVLPRGRPIFCEKPLTNDLAAARALPEAAQRLVFIMHKWRYHPGVIELARIAASGRFGPVEGLRTYRLGWGNSHADVSSLWILTPHDLSIVLEVLGEVPRLVSASADPMGQGSDGAVAHLITKAGVPMAMETSSGHPTPLRRIILRCRDAVCQLDSSDYGTIFVRRFDGTDIAPIALDDDMPLLAELRAFITHLRGGPSPVTSLEQELSILEVITDIESAIARS